MRKGEFLLITVLALFIQILFSSYFRFWDRSVDFMLVASILAGALFGKNSGVFTGLACGMMADHGSNAFFGTHIFSYIMIGFLAGSTKADGHNFLSRAVLIGIFSILNGFFVYCFLTISGFSFGAWESFTSIILPQALLNVFIGSLFSSLFLWLRGLLWGNKMHGKSSDYRLDHLF